MSEMEQKTTLITGITGVYRLNSKKILGAGSKVIFSFAIEELLDSQFRVQLFLQIFTCAGGGLGGTRVGGPDENIKHSGRVENTERYE